MLPKPGKNHQIPINFRPISLLKCIGKLFEKILSTRLIQILENQNFFNKWQRAYLSKKETTEHIFRLGTHANHAIAKKHFTAAILLDVEKAFDSVWHNSLKHKLSNLNLPPYLTTILSSFLDSRTIKVKSANEISQQVKLAAGTPQGSVLSPILFIIYVNDIPSNPQNKTYISQFADDLGLWTSDKNPNYVQIKLQRALKELETWCAKWHVKLNPTKTQLLPITKGTRTIKLQLYNTPIETAHEAKLLGVTFDKNMNLKAHTKNLVQKSNQRISLVRRLKCTNMGTNPETIIKLYKAYIRPILEIGAVLTADKPLRLAELQIIQNKLIRIAYKLPRTIPIPKLHEISKLELLTERLPTLKTKSIERFKNSDLMIELEQYLLT